MGGPSVHRAAQHCTTARTGSLGRYLKGTAHALASMVMLPVLREPVAPMSPELLGVGVEGTALAAGADEPAATPEAPSCPGAGSELELMVVWACAGSISSERAPTLLAAASAPSLESRRVRNLSSSSDSAAWGLRQRGGRVGGKGRFRRTALSQAKLKRGHAQGWPCRTAKSG